ncbi:MAG: NfeD family protein, partial [SAR324 cluster bacterium]
AVSRPLIGATALALAGLAAVVGRLVVRSMRQPRRSLRANLAGQRAVVVRAIAPGREGSVRVLGELWRARIGPAGVQALAPGTAAVVRGVDGLTLIVEETKE